LVKEWAAEKVVVAVGDAPFPVAKAKAKTKAAAKAKPKALHNYPQ